MSRLPACGMHASPGSVGLSRWISVIPRKKLTRWPATVRIFAGCFVKRRTKWGFGMRGGNETPGAIPGTQHAPPRREPARRTAKHARRSRTVHRQPRRMRVPRSDSRHRRESAEQRPSVSADTADRRSARPRSTAMMLRSRRPFSVEMSGAFRRDGPVADRLRALHARDAGGRFRSQQAVASRRGRPRADGRRPHGVPGTTPAGSLCARTKKATGAAPSACTSHLPGPQRVHRQGRRGRPFDVHGRYTHVYIEQNGRWRLVTAQVAPIKEG